MWEILVDEGQTCLKISFDNALNQYHNLSFISYEMVVMHPPQLTILTRIYVHVIQRIKAELKRHKNPYFRLAYVSHTATSFNGKSPEVCIYKFSIIHPRMRRSTLLYQRGEVRGVLFDIWIISRNNEMSHVST